jgi:hypothetical protein
MSKAKILEELAKRAESGADSLALDFSSRMQRAKEQGFSDKTYYHGTQADFQSFQEGKPIFMSPDEGLANTFSQMRSGQGGSQVMNLRTNASNPFDSTNNSHLDALEKELDMTGNLFIENSYGEKVNLIDGIRSGQFNMVEDEAAIQAMKGAGFDSFYIRERPYREVYAEADRIDSNVFPDTQEGKQEAMALLKGEMDKYHTYGSGINRLKPTIKKQGDGFQVSYQGDTFENSALNEHSLNEMKRNIAVLDPSNTRSVNAAFDPANINKSDLLGQATVPGMIGGAGLGLAGLLAMEGEPYRNQTAQAARYPVAGSIADTLGRLETPIGRPFAGLSDYVNKINYGDDIGILDRLGAVPDPYEFSKLLE